MPSWFAAVNKQKTSLTTNQAGHSHTRRRWRSSVRNSYSGKALSFWLEFIAIKPVKTFFVYKCKFSLSLSLLYLVDLFINKLKTKFDNLFYRMILNTKRIHNSFEEISPQELDKFLQKFFVGEKKRRQRPFGHCAPKLWEGDNRGT